MIVPLATNLPHYMHTVFYKIIYFPIINTIIRNLLRITNLLLSKPIRIPISGVVSYKMPDGKTFRLDGNESCYTSLALYWDKPINYEFTDIFIDLVKNCQVFFDIGANIGYFTVLAQVYNPDIQICAFEPANGAYDYLLKNIKLNHGHKSKGFKLALAGINGVIQFFDVVSKYTYLKHHLNGSSSTQNEKGLRKMSQYNVDSMTLDNFVEKNNITKLDLIKMDTEFTEHFILQKGHQTIERFKPIIISEVYSEIEDEFEREIKLHDYQIYLYTENKLKYINTFKDIPSKELDVSHDRNFFFVPTEKVVLIQAYIL